MKTFVCRVTTKDGCCKIHAIRASEYADARMILKNQYERCGFLVRHIALIDKY